MEQSPFWDTQGLYKSRTSLEFMGPQGSLPQLCRPATGPKPQLDLIQSILSNPVHDPFQYYPSTYA